MVLIFGAVDTFVKTKTVSQKIITQLNDSESEMSWHHFSTLEEMLGTRVNDAKYAK